MLRRTDPRQEFQEAVFLLFVVFDDFFVEPAELAQTNGFGGFVTLSKSNRYDDNCLFPGDRAPPLKTTRAVSPVPGLV